MYRAVEELIRAAEKGAILCVGGSLTLFTQMPRRGVFSETLTQQGEILANRIGAMGRYAP